MLTKGVDFEYIEQDPYNKSPEWLAINPRGLIPVIVHNGKSIYESHVCIEYIDESWPNEPRLLPKDPYQRAKLACGVTLCLRNSFHPITNSL